MEQFRVDEAKSSTMPIKCNRWEINKRADPMKNKIIISSFLSRP